MPASRADLLFLHANGFPTGVYNRYLEALRAQRRVHAPPVIDSPVTLRGGQRWPHMVDGVTAEIRRLAAERGPIALVGHSMGGYLSMIASARLGDEVCAIVLIDSPLVMGWRRAVFESLKAAGLTRHGGPAPIALRRRNRWESAADAQAHFAPKSLVRHWAPGVLDDFIAHGLKGEHGVGVSLRIAREIEADIYAHLPTTASWRAFRKLRARVLPVFLVAGRRSRGMDMAGRAANRRLFGDRWREVDAGHLVPMEAPAACAATVLACVAEVDG